MNMTKIKEAYRSQRDSATKKRGIEWQFTWETWLAWWGDDIVNRGRRRGQLVQARKGDLGPYSPDNCVKLTHGQNVIDAHLGKTHSAEHRAKVSAALKGRPLSEKTKAKMSATIRRKHAERKAAAMNQ